MTLLVMRWCSPAGGYTYLRKSRNTKRTTFNLRIKLWGKDLTPRVSGGRTHSDSSLRMKLINKAFLKRLMGKVKKKKKRKKISHSRNQLAPNH